MATAREHFALDWIKADLLETLNEARVALDDYAEQAGDEMRMRVCLTCLHQVHGTLVMLELKGVTQLADHLEQLAQAMLAKQVEEEAAAGQALMQGILELPGYLDELQRGGEDSVSTSMPLVNEIRKLLGQSPLVDPAGTSLSEGASPEVIARFNAIGGPEKVARIRSAYQNVLLSILKGEDRAAAVSTLGKIAVGLEKVTAGAPLARQWQAFAEFVASLKQQTGVLESEAVKLLRRVDLEIKNLAKDGDGVLQQPINMELVQQLLDAAEERDHHSEKMVGLQEAVARDVSNNTLAISGRQALSSAASALQEDLNVVKDKMDLLVRSGHVDLEELRSLAAPLRQIGSTLSLLGFESSREIVSDQVDAIENLVVLGDSDPKGVQSIAGALVQIDENLSSIVQGSGQTEVEQITSEAQLQVLKEARKDLDHIKQCIVDFVTAHWSTNHLASVPHKIADISGALAIVPLPRAINMLARVRDYVEQQLMQGHRPEWDELDQFADVVSAVDYYLERLTDESSSGAEDILVVAERELAELEARQAAAPGAAQGAVADAADQEQTTSDDALLQEPAFSLDDLGSDEAPDHATLSVEDLESTAVSPEAEDTTEVQETEAFDEAATVDHTERLDTENLPNLEEPKLELEEDAAFDLSSDVFADLDGAVDETAAAAEPESPEPEPAETEVTGADFVDADSVDAELADAESAELDVEEEIAQQQPAIDEPAQVLASDQAEDEKQVETEQASPIEPPDPEIVEIFVEEVDEVLETINEYLPQWADGFDNPDALTEVRRAFHTLKGSGRIVQAAAIGELAWGIENMLNRVIDGTVSPNAQFVAAIDAARELVPSLRDAFEQGQVGDLDAVGMIIEQADVLSSGGEIDVAALRQSSDADSRVAEEAIEPDLAEETQLEELQTEELQTEELEESLETSLADADEFSLETLPPVDHVEKMSAEATVEDAEEGFDELVDADDILASFDDVEDIDLAFADADTTAEDSTQKPAQEAAQEAAQKAVEENANEASEASSEMAAETDEAISLEELSTLELFVGEAIEHLQTIQRENARSPWRLSDAIARAFHTLSGGAALAELAEVQLIVDPAYQVVEAYRYDAPTAELQQFFQQAAQHLDACLQALQIQATWDEPLEFVAAADDLLAVRNSAPRAVDRLLDAAPTAALFEAEDEFEEYLAKQSRDAHSNTIQTTLREIVELAEDADAHALSSTANALAAALARADQNDQLVDTDAAVLREAFQLLIDQLNEIAAGTRPVVAEPLLAQLAELPTTVLSIDQEAPSATEAAEQQSTPETVAAAASQAADEDVLDLNEIDADLANVFFEEAEEISEELEASIVSWSAERDNRLHMENMLRGLHTLKGGARLCGLVKLGECAHDFETIVIEVQSDERSIDDDLFTNLHARFDDITNRLANIKQQAASPQAPAPQAADSANVVEMPSTEPASAGLTQMEPQAAEPMQAADATATDEANEPRVSDVNKVVAAVVAPTAPAQPAEADGLPASTVADAPSQQGNKAPKVERSNQEMVRVGSALLEELVNLAGESSILRARIEQGMSDFTGALDEMEITIERLREQLRRLEIETETQILHRHERTDGPQYENFDPLEMDRYSQLQQLSRSLSESASDMLDLKETLLFKARESETLLLQQARINTELQEGLMRTRMVPFSRLLPRLRRIVRQVSTELEKDVEFHVQNAEGELDRNLLERMVPPLEHMLRNAVDHGIESAEMRRNFGKSPTGRIDLRLTREGGDVVIEISDDGAGIDAEVIRAKAIERGLMAADANLSDDEILQFVLAAGFSTAKSVTQISGRGVGLDVVHSEVKQLGGSVNIVSRPGKGTRFVIRVPFTVSVNRALMVSVAEDLYAIPLNTIEGIVLLSPDQLQGLYNSDSKTFEYAGVPYRVRYLGQYLGREYRGSAVGQGSVPMVLVRSGDHAVAIHVDQVQGSREIVVKSLGPQFAGVGGISGATILGDGSVVVILDLLALIRAQHHESVKRSSANYAQRSGPRCVMVVDDSVTVRKVTSRLLERQGMDVLVAKDGVEAVAMLQERRPDVMLLDIEMPRMDGFEVARQVRHDERLGNLPIVMISSRTGDKHKEHASQLGVNKFLGKPFQENELLATIDELVSQR